MVVTKRQPRPVSPPAPSARVRRLALIALLLAVSGAATALIVQALRRDLVFFYSPSQLAAKETPAGRSFRLGGLVERGSVRRAGGVLRFVVTDTVRRVAVRFDGLDGGVPALFGEGRGVVAQGRLGGDGVFVARELYAKHAEGYAPPAPGEALNRARAGQYPVELAPERSAAPRQAAPALSLSSSARAAPSSPGAGAVITQVGMRSR